MPVAAAYRGPYSKNGYLRIRARRITPDRPKPAKAPARVDCTKWEIPIAVAAQSRPGPKADQNRDRWAGLYGCVMRAPARPCTRALLCQTRDKRGHGPHRAPAPVPYGAGPRTRGRTVLKQQSAESTCRAHPLTAYLDRCSDRSTWYGPCPSDAAWSRESRAARPAVRPPCTQTRRSTL